MPSNTSSVPLSAKERITVPIITAYDIGRHVWRATTRASWPRSASPGSRQNAVLERTQQRQLIGQTLAVLVAAVPVVALAAAARGVGDEAAAESALAAREAPVPLLLQAGAEACHVVRLGVDVIGDPRRLLDGLTDAGLDRRMGLRRLPGRMGGQSLLVVL